jgi:hypothetical protein
MDPGCSKDAVRLTDRGRDGETLGRQSGSFGETLELAPGDLGVHIDVIRERRKAAVGAGDDSLWPDD